MKTPYGAWRATYTHGRWVVLGGPTCLVIMQPAPPAATRLVNGIWDKIIGAASIVDGAVLAHNKGIRCLDIGQVFCRDAAGVGGLAANVVGHEHLGAGDGGHADSKSDSAGKASGKLGGAFCKRGEGLHRFRFRRDGLFWH